MTKKNKFSMLIVDDDPDLCTILSLNLSFLADIHMESTLAGAMNYLECNASSVILLDNNLPDGEGVRFIEKIKRLNTAAKVVVITSDTSEDLRKKSLEAGAASFLNKPFNIKTIADTLQQI